MKIFKKILKGFLFLFLFLIVLGIILFTKVDRTPYQEMPYYRQMLSEVEQVQNFEELPKGDTIRAGWAKVNIVPDYPTPLAGFGNRRGKLMEGIRDSVWLRAFVFDNLDIKAAFITMDLLIVPPEVVISLKSKLKDKGFDAQNIYLTATHTHCSIGSWGPGFTGEAIAGDFDPQIVELISNAALNAVEKADLSKEKAKIGFGQIDAAAYVANRLVGEEGSIDPWFRILKIEKESGETSILSTFSAHATCFGHRYMHLTRDYPGVLVDSLEQLQSVDFAAFAAGGVASHRPASQPTAEEQLAFMANGLYNLVRLELDNISTEYEFDLRVLHVPLPLREPHVRIAENWRLRPWVFYQVFGDYPSTISFMRIGNNVWVGTPCDFSGELIPDFQDVVREENINLLVTSFNGGYIGYITLDQYYDLNKYETRAMNWFGPYNGAYFGEIINRVLKKI
ncbi:hypothetical protein BH23BAC1_BH23BAC1_03330 [soil metagenome]